MRAPVLVALLVVAGVAGVAPAAAPAQVPEQGQAQAPPRPVVVKPPEIRTEILEQILVKVNGEIVTKTDLEERQVAALRQRGRTMSDEELRKAIAEVTPEVLVDAVDELLLMQRGKELGYKVTDEQFKRVLENIRKENKLEDDAQFEAALKQEGLDLAQLRANIERQMIFNQVQQVEVMGRITVSEAEAQAYYNEHRNEFATPSQITLRELMIAVPGDGRSVNVALDEQAKGKAEAVLARARKGESFEALVAEFSDSPSKATGGLVGPLSSDELAPEIRKLLEARKPGEVTDVFRTTSGWAILKVESASKAETKTFEQARDEIADRVFQSKRAGEFLKYMHKLRGQAIIDWKNLEMKKLFEAHLAVMK